MKCPERKKGETKKDYAIRCHWCGCKHTAIGKKLGWTTGQVRHVVYGDNMELKWTNKQKIAFIKIQDVFVDIGLTNQEVAEMFITFEDKEQVATMFQFQTGRWMSQLKKEI